MTDTKLKTEDTTSHTPGPWRIYNVLSNHEILTDRKTSHETVSIALFSTNPSTANARRIVAAVNACEGISTEALERGVIADLRHVLGQLLTAASDLDAAIDGVTAEFDDERDRLNADIRAAQAAFTKATGRAA